MIEISSITEATRSQYTAYVNAHPDARFGHDLAWADALRDTYGVDVEHLLATDGDKVVGICPLFFCKPLFGSPHYQTSLFPSYFGALTDTPEILSAIVESLAAKAQRVACAEILAPAALPASEYLPYVENLDTTYRVPLTGGTDALFQKLDRDYKRILKKPKAAEMEIVVDQEGALLDEFYTLYVGVYAGKHGFIPHDIKLFRNIFARYPKGAARIYAVRIRGVPVGGVFTMWAHGEAYYAWSAVLPNSQFHPTHFLLWQLIQDASAEGCAVFNMGEAQKDNRGLQHFKLGWGAEVSEPRRYYLPGMESQPTPRLFDRFAWTKTVISHLPGFVVANTLSRAIRFFL